MTTKKHTFRRLKPNGLQTKVTFDSADQEIALDADILDISYTGIRVKLKQPIASDLAGYIKITMILPESGTSFSVHGILTHQHIDSECGAHYVDHSEGSIDDVMFECIELDNSTVFIKTH